MCSDIINILIPAMGKSQFFKDSYFPKMMIEIAGKTVLEHVVDNFADLSGRHYVFVFGRKECSEFHINESAKILTKDRSDVLILENETEGALCTCLMAVKMISSDTPLLISNCDQTIDVNYRDVIKSFCAADRDAGVITFDSIHPRWSYAKLKGEEVVEVAEKRPLSKHAIAGIYYFRRGKDFVEAAKRAILKGCSVGEKYYISASLNELVLMGKSIGYFEVERDAYHSFYSFEKIREYEHRLKGVRG